MKNIKYHLSWALTVDRFATNEYGRRTFYFLEKETMFGRKRTEHLGRNMEDDERGVKRMFWTTEWTQIYQVWESEIKQVSKGQPLKAFEQVNDMISKAVMS